MAQPLPRQIPNLDGLGLPGALIEAVRQLFQRLYDLRDRVINQDAPQDNIAQIAYASANLTLTSAYQDVVGTTLSLTRTGRYLISATFDLSLAGAGDFSQNLLGQMVADGVAQAQGVTVSSSTTIESCATQHWLYAPTFTGKVVKLQAKKSAGTGTSTCNKPNTSITALWIGP